MESVCVVVFKQFFLSRIYTSDLTHVEMTPENEKKTKFFFKTFHQYNIARVTQQQHCLYWCYGFYDIYVIPSTVIIVSRVYIYMW